MSEKMKVLIAYDGSSCADAALDDLRYAGLPRVAEALSMSVADVFLQPPSSQEAACPVRVPVAVQQAWTRATHAVEEAQTLAQRAQAQVLTYFPTWDVRAEACADSPAWAVIKQARYLAAGYARRRITRPLCHESLAAWECVTKGPQRRPLLGSSGAQPPLD